MELEEIIKLKKKLKPRMELGDYVTLGKMFNIAQNTARARYLRSNEEAVLAMKEIIESREELINKFKKD
jgi:hypothetical protein